MTIEPHRLQGKLTLYLPQCMFRLVTLNNKHIYICLPPEHIATLVTETRDEIRSMNQQIVDKKNYTAIRLYYICIHATKGTEKVEIM
jgi:hypothetical protein